MKFKNTLILLTLLLSVSLVAQDSFVRKNVIPIPAADSSLGIGNVLAGVDFDGDGKTEMYFVNDMLDQAGQTYTPRMYKYEFNGTSWDSVWSAELPRTQNTWPGLAEADLDGDGKPEVVWTPAEGATTPSPSRIYVFEAPGDGSDNMGVADGSGGWKPNTEWNFDIPDAKHMRAIKIVVADFDNDGKQEVALADRKSYFSMAIVSVSDVPDNADGSESWTLEFNGKDVQANKFIRNGEIVSPDGGFGNVVAGMDYDGDGFIEMYAVNNDWNDGNDGELIPTLYKYEYVHGAWIKKWETIVPDIPAQNTWPVLIAGDWDNDGRGEVIWCPVNNLSDANPNPSRIVVYEFPGDSTSDAMGVDNGDGSWKPNASWNMGITADKTEMRPFNGLLADVDSDGKKEFVFVERKKHYGWGVVGVDKIPDNGDGSEVWTMKMNGSNPIGSYRDLSLLNGNLVVFESLNNRILKINTATGDTISNQQGGVFPWRSANTVDIDNDGNDEIVIGAYSGDRKGEVLLLTEDPSSDTLVTYTIANFATATYKQISSIKAGDIDADSLMDFIVGFKYSSRVERIEYQGGDITDPANYITTLLDPGLVETDKQGQIDVIALANIDGDAADEVFFAGPPRSMDVNLLNMVVGDFGDWSIGSSNWDIVSVGNGAAAVGISYGGDIFPVSYNADSSKYEFGHFQSGLNAGSNMLSACAADVDGDEFDEIFYSNYSSTQVYMLKGNENGAAVSYQIADLADLGAVRLTGGAAGDIDGDGNLDLVFGTRSSSPNNSLYRVKYTGGDPTDASNWTGELIDSEILPANGQIDIVRLANVDADADLEIIYSGLPRDDGFLPIVILDIQKIQAETIAAVRIDANADGVPDRKDEEVTTKGVVTSYNFSTTGLLFTIQDETAGIQLYDGGNDSTNYEIGDLILVKGTVSQYRGLTEIYFTPENISKLGSSTAPAPAVLSVEEYLMNAEKYEGSLITINALQKTSGTWPDSGKWAKIQLWDGNKDFAMFIDPDVGIPEKGEPTYPINLTGVCGQFTKSTPPLDGYQVIPRMYNDIEPDVAAPPSPYFFFTDETKTEYDGKTIQISTTDQEFTFAWNAAVDLNGDNLIYQMQMIVEGTPVEFNAADTFVTVTGKQIIDALGSSKDAKITVRTKGAESALVSSVDTLSVTFSNVVGVDEENMIPKEFYVDQNYPNPFNPTTTIKFGLPVQAEVNLIIYDILGREVSRIISSQVMNAGNYNYSFDASNLSSGTYIYRLQADQKVEIKKMLLLK